MPFLRDQGAPRTAGSRALPRAAEDAVRHLAYQPSRAGVHGRYLAARGIAQPRPLAPLTAHQGPLAPEPITRGPRQPQSGGPMHTLALAPESRIHAPSDATSAPTTPPSRSPCHLIPPLVSRTGAPPRGPTCDGTLPVNPERLPPRAFPNTWTLAPRRRQGGRGGIAPGASAGRQGRRPPACERRSACERRGHRAAHGVSATGRRGERPALRAADARSAPARAPGRRTPRALRAASALAGPTGRCAHAVNGAPGSARAQSCASASRA